MRAGRGRNVSSNGKTETKKTMFSVALNYNNNNNKKKKTVLRESR